jgi:CheY-like chemotaxis protein
LEVRELLRAPLRVEDGPVLAPAVRIGKRARRALVVDDSLSARRGLAQLLGDAGYAVSTASDGIDALTQIEAAVPDVILLDMEMPRMDGLELTAHLRGNSAWREVPIVMITSRAADKHRTQALRTGVNDYVTKPYQEHELIDRLFTLAPP